MMENPRLYATLFVDDEPGVVTKVEPIIPGVFYLEVGVSFSIRAGKSTLLDIANTIITFFEEERRGQDDDDPSN